MLITLLSANIYQQTRSFYRNYMKVFFYARTIGLLYQFSIIDAKKITGC